MRGDHSRALPFAFVPITLAGGLLGGLPACVPVNERPRTGLTYADPAATPAVARPPTDARGSTDSRVRVSVRPLGAVPFDGMTLPVVSPDGRFIAAQSGALPPWDVLLAQPRSTGQGTGVPARLQVLAARLQAPDSTPTPRAPGEPPGGLSPLPWSGTLPRGLLLGRSADVRGVLVERPDDTGARAIGLVDWSSGQISWLANDPGTLNAHASFGPGGELAYSRRTLDQGPSAGFELVVRPEALSAANESVLRPGANETLCFPTFSADRSRVFVFSAATGQIPGFGPLTLLCVRLPQPGIGTELVVESRVELGVEPTIAAAYQAVAAGQSPWSLPGDFRVDDDLARGLAITDIRTGGMIWIDGRSGRVDPLAPGTAGAVPWWVSGSSSRAPLELGGLILGAAKELVYQPRNDRLGWGPEVKVVSGAAIPRLAGVLAVPRQGREHSNAQAGPVQRVPRFVLLSPPTSGTSSDRTLARGQGGSGPQGMVQVIEMIPITD